MTRYEYRFDAMPWGMASQERLIRERGHEGWRFVDVLNGRFVFERPLPPTKAHADE